MKQVKATIILSDIFPKHSFRLAPPGSEFAQSSRERPTELSGLKMTNMNLQKTAEAEKERRTRSKLEPHREAIFTLRRKASR